MFKRSYKARIVYHMISGFRGALIILTDLTLKQKLATSRCQCQLDSCVPLSIRVNMAKFGFYIIQKFSKEFSVQKSSFYLYHINVIVRIIRNSSMQKSRLSGRDRKLWSVGWDDIPPQPIDHVSATSLKFLFARIDGHEPHRSSAALLRDG